MKPRTVPVLLVSILKLSLAGLALHNYIFSVRNLVFIKELQLALAHHVDLLWISFQNALVTT